MENIFNVKYRGQLVFVARVDASLKAFVVLSMQPSGTCLVFLKSCWTIELRNQKLSFALRNFVVLPIRVFFISLRDASLKRFSTGFPALPKILNWFQRVFV